VKPARRILDRDAANVAFADLVRLLVALGFSEVSGKGSHRVYARPGVAELVNLQEDGEQANPYPVALQLEDKDDT
jgi:hypothetical protein